MDACAYPLQGGCVERQHARVRPRLGSPGVLIDAVIFEVPAAVDTPHAMHMRRLCRTCMHSRVTSRVPHREHSALLLFPSQVLWPQHLSTPCRCRTQSEVVVPVINREGDLLGVLDVDSELPAIFTGAGKDLVKDLYRIGSLIYSRGLVITWQPWQAPADCAFCARCRHRRLGGGVLAVGQLCALTLAWQGLRRTRIVDQLPDCALCMAHCPRVPCHAVRDESVPLPDLGLLRPPCMAEDK